MPDMKAQIIIDAVDRASGVLRGVAGTAAGTSQQLQATAASMRRWGLGLMAVGGGVVAGLSGLAAQAARTGDELAKAAKRIGINVEALSALKHAAELSGASFSELEMSLRLVSRTAFEASQGTAEYAEAWQQLGVSVVDSQGNLKSADQLLLDAADGFARLQNDTEAAALAQELFGRSGTRLLPMLKQGREGIRGMMEEARRLGLVMSQEDAKAAEEMTDAMHRWRMTTHWLGVEIGTLLLPVLTDMANWLAEKIGAIKNWVDEHKTLARVIAEFVGGGGLLAMLGGGILYVVGVIANSITSIQALAAAWGNVATNAAAAAEAQAGAAGAGAGAGAGAAGAGWRGGGAVRGAATAGGTLLGVLGISGAYAAGKRGEGASWGGFLQTAGGGALVGGAQGGLIGAGIGFAAGGAAYMIGHFAGRRSYSAHWAEWEQRKGELTPAEWAALGRMPEEKRRQLLARGFDALKAELQAEAMKEDIKRQRPAAQAAAPKAQGQAATAGTGVVGAGRSVNGRVDVNLNVRGDPETVRIILRDPNARAELFRVIGDAIRSAAYAPA